MSILIFFQLSSQEINVVFLSEFFLRRPIISSLLNLIINLFQLLKPLLNSSIQLHCILSCMFECLFEIGDLPGKFPLWGFVSSVLFFYLRQILNLDCSSFENCSLHFLNYLLLFFTKLFISKLHSMNFFLHGYDFRLSNIGV
jgi:hypothetical protein